MDMNLQSAFFLCLMAPLIGRAQGPSNEKNFTRSDTLRGSITAERSWWDVLRYDLRVTPDYTRKTISGKNRITYRVVQAPGGRKMQVDLQEPLHIDSILFNDRQRLAFSKEGAAWHVAVPRQQKATVNAVTVFYSGTPREAVRAPWDGGWTFARDSLGRPWMTVTCQGLGASVWYPCKDHQGDEPDKGASLEMVVPDTLVAVANGRLQSHKNNGDGTASYKWQVVNPINNYNIIPYIGKYVHFSEGYTGEKGRLDLDYWVLDYNEAKAKDYLPKEAKNMLKAFEYWFGPYPFYEDGYKLVDVPHTGMEHQSAVAYGNWYKPGYRMRDGSGTGWGLKWDFIVIHESGHEWFGNNITSKDLADMWVHESFTNYSETLFVDYIFGTDAANEYNYGIRKGIRNDQPVIPPYGVNAQGSGDMYPKGGNLLHSIRHSINDDERFRQILRGLNNTFYHKTVTTQQIEKYISANAGFDYSKVFDQYLRTIQIPKLEFYFNENKTEVSFRYTNCIKGFNLPLSLSNKKTSVKIVPSKKWNTLKLKGNQADLFTVEAINKMYYISPELVKDIADH
jgi:aminopeptidase N